MEYFTFRRIAQPKMLRNGFFLANYAVEPYQSQGNRPDSDQAVKKKELLEIVGKGVFMARKMTLNFTKMHGAGNDFVMIENLDGSVQLTTEQIAQLCDRRFGVGADGLVLLEKAPTEKLDAQMIYFNADGSRAEMCGNAARCFTAFSLAHEVGNPLGLSFRTDAGDLVSRAKDSVYTVEMTPPFDTRLNFTLDLSTGPATLHYTNTGVPHVVKFVNDVVEVDMVAEGSELRYHQAFLPKGANANFAQINGNAVIIRTYERGVENETLACGTGVTAVAILAHLVHHVAKPVSLKVAGGDTLSVDFQVNGNSIEQVTLTGPATVVYSGRIEI